VYGQLDSDDGAIGRVMDVLTDEAQDFYTRGLAARTLGAVCLKVW
jgi:hypothetical protein